MCSSSESCPAGQRPIGAAESHMLLRMQYRHEVGNIAHVQLRRTSAKLLKDACPLVAHAHLEQLSRKNAAGRYVALSEEKCIGLYCAYGVAVRTLQLCVSAMMLIVCARRKQSDADTYAYVITVPPMN